MGESVDELIERFAGVIGGPMDRSTANRVQYLTRRGELFKLLPGVHLRAVPPSPSPSPESDALVAAAAMAYDPAAVIGGRAAAALTFWPEIGPGEVLVYSRRQVGAKRPLMFRDRVVPEELVCTVNGVRLTCPALTALDLCVGPRGAAPLDRAVLRGRTTVEDLRSALALTPDAPGNSTRRRLVRDMGTNACSELEREAHRRLRAAGITDWVANEGRHFGGRWLVPDLRFRGRRVLAEFDGYEFHSDRESFQRDRTKSNLATTDNWWVLRFTHGDVFGGGFIGVTRSALRRAPRY